MEKIKNDEEFYAAIDAIAASGARLETLEAQHKEAKVALDLYWGKIIEAVEKPHKADFKRVKTYALQNRERLLGKDKSASTKAATWGFKDNPAKVIPIVKITDAAMVEQLRALPENRGFPYLNVAYTLDKSKLADAINKGVKWVKSLFQLTQDEQFFADKIKEKKGE